jgi:catechol 2,3-dioxygenase-like lactoylglutathione lyase family enzyme
VHSGGAPAANPGAPLNGTLSGMRITGICLVTPDVRRLCAFYASLLHTEATPDSSDTFAALALPGDQLAISFFTEEGMERMAPGVTAEAGRGAHTLEIRLDSAAAVDAAHDRLRREGVRIAKPPSTQSWGRRSVWVRDPDGNLVNLYADVPA